MLPKRCWNYFSLSLLFAPITGTVAAGWGDIPPRDNKGTVLIRTTWVIQKDGEPKSGSGTGFVIDSSGAILTVAHQFPVDPVFSVINVAEIEAWPSTYPAQTFDAKIETIDRSADFAILRPVGSPSLTAVPLQWNWQPAEYTAVTARGFPLGGRLQSQVGMVSQSGGGDRVPTSMILRAGYSGSPVYDPSGTVIGMVRGGFPLAGTNDPTVMGTGFFIPLSLLKSRLPPGLVGPSTTTPPAVPTVPVQEQLVSYSINETKETQGDCNPLDLSHHTQNQPRSYVLKFQAVNGYRIVSYNFVDHSVTRMSDRTVEFVDNGALAIVAFKLTSGPRCNRVRGWLESTLTTVQVPLKEKR